MWNFSFLLLHPANISGVERSAVLRSAASPHSLSLQVFFIRSLHLLLLRFTMLRLTRHITGELLLYKMKSLKAICSSAGGFSLTCQTPSVSWRCSFCFLKRWRRRLHVWAPSVLHQDENECSRRNRKSCLFKSHWSETNTVLRESLGCLIFSHRHFYSLQTSKAI